MEKELDAQLGADLVVENVAWFVGMGYVSAVNVSEILLLNWDSRNIGEVKKRCNLTL